MRKFMFGCGGAKVKGWECHDMDVDIRKPLPFPTACASHIHSEHTVEHLTHQEAWRFFQECHRVLAKGGIVRIAIPDIERMWIRMENGMGDRYIDVASGEKTEAGAIRAAVFNHGHRAAWTGFMLSVFLQSVGFQKCKFCDVGESEHMDLRHIEQHGKLVGEDINDLETTIVEGVRP